MRLPEKAPSGELAEPLAKQELTLWPATRAFILLHMSLGVVFQNLYSNTRRAVVVVVVVAEIVVVVVGVVATPLKTERSEYVMCEFCQRLLLQAASPYSLCWYIVLFAVV